MKTTMFIGLIMLVCSCSQEAKIKLLKKQMTDSAIAWKRVNDSLDVVEKAVSNRYDSLLQVLIVTSRKISEQRDSLTAANESLKDKYWVAKNALGRLKRRIVIFRGNPNQLMFSKTWYNRIVYPVDKNLLMD